MEAAQSVQLEHKLAHTCLRGYTCVQDCLAARQLQSDMLLSSAMAQTFERQRRQEAEDARMASNLAGQPARGVAVPVVVQRQYEAQVTAAATEAVRPDTPAPATPAR
jgi:hypothetical protein